MFYKVLITTVNSNYQVLDTNTNFQENQKMEAYAAYYSACAEACSPADGVIQSTVVLMLYNKGYMNIVYTQTFDYAEENNSISGNDLNIVI